MTQLSFLALCAFVNRLGLEASSGYGVACKIVNFAMLIPSALMQSMASFISQNIGAGKHQRARQTLLTRVVVRAVDLQPAVFEQILRDFLARDGGVHGQAVGLRVPIGRAAVLFAGEALGADVELRVLAVIGGEELEDIPFEESIEDVRSELNPEMAMDQQEAKRLVMEILDHLPEDQRVVIGMFYYEEMSVKDIAQTLGVSENTVKAGCPTDEKK